MLTITHFALISLMVILLIVLFVQDVHSSNHLDLVGLHSDLDNIGSQSISINDTQQYLIYQNSSWGLQMQYPNTWLKQEGTGYYFSDAPGIPTVCFPNVVSFSPVQKGSGHDNNTLSVYVNLIPSTLEQYLGITLPWDIVKDTNLQAYRQGLYGEGQWIQGFELINDDTNRSIDGKESYELMYSKDDGRFNVIEAGIYADNLYVYNIVYSAIPQVFSENLPKVQHMIDSVRIGTPHSIPQTVINELTYPTNWKVPLTKIIDIEAHEPCADVQGF